MIILSPTCPLLGGAGVVIPNYYSIILVKYYMQNTLFNSLILLTILFPQRERERERETNKVKTHLPLVDQKHEVLIILYVIIGLTIVLEN